VPKLKFEQRLEELYAALKELGKIPPDWTYEKMKEWIQNHRRESSPK